MPGPSECWEWSGSRDRKGYGFGDGGRAHRLAWEWENGPVPAGLMVLHRCDNPPCCNPKHLFVGTALDNARDALAKGHHHNAGKTHCPRGHELSDTGRGRRDCKTCKTIRNHARYPNRHLPKPPHPKDELGRWATKN